MFVSHILFVMSERTEQCVCIKFCEKLEKTRTETYALIKMFLFYLFYFIIIIIIFFILRGDHELCASC